MNITFTRNSQAEIQVGRFLVVGCSAVATDFLSYVALLPLLSHTSAKTLSFIFGTIVAYVFNKYWTFKRPRYDRSEIMRFATLYASTLGANVLVNHLSLQLFPSLVIVAFLAATSTSTILNFIGQKWWVFRD